MALRACPTIPSDLIHEQAFESNTSILHATSSDIHLTLQYWITTRSILPTFTQDRREAGFTTIYFNLFSSEAMWACLYPEHPISNTISVQLNETTPPTLPSLASSMPTSSTPVTPPTHIYPSNQAVDPITKLIAIMHHSL